MAVLEGRVEVDSKVEIGDRTVVEVEVVFRVEVEGDNVTRV